MGQVGGAGKGQAQVIKWKRGEPAPVGRRGTDGTDWDSIFAAAKQGEYLEVRRTDANRLVMAARRRNIRYVTKSVGESTVRFWFLGKGK
jgi:hypothetical protein